MLNPSQKHIKFMAFPLHVTTPAIHVNRSSPLPFSAYLCHAFPKGDATVRLQTAEAEKPSSRRTMASCIFIKTRRYDIMARKPELRNRVGITETKKEIIIMAEVSKTPANVAINAMQAIPFSSMIGGPLNACIEAQAMAARTSWEFIKEVGLNTDEKGQKSAVMVAFSFNRGGRMVQLNVPLLTIVPIPYIAINTIDINFKASISASSSTASETTEHTEAGGELGAKAELNLGLFSMEANLKANYSSKKDSKATAESKYSVESTIDVAVKAGQEGMPAGMAKVLELLGSALDVVDAKGELQVNATILNVGDNLVIAYKNKEGLFDNSVLKVKKGDTDVVISDADKKKDSVVLNLNAEKFKAGDVLEITAGENTVKVNVVKKETEDTKSQE